MKSLWLLAAGSLLLCLGLWLGTVVGKDEYVIPVPPPTDISCVPNYVVTDVWAEGMTINHMNDPCMEDEVIAYVPGSHPNRVCVNADDYCIDIVEAYK
jgi:hypothetical protein